MTTQNRPWYSDSFAKFYTQWDDLTHKLHRIRDLVDQIEIASTPIIRYMPNGGRFEDNVNISCALFELQRTIEGCDDSWDWYEIHKQKRKYNLIEIYIEMAENIIFRAEDALRKCRIISRGIIRAQRSFRERYYQPGGAGERRAKERFESSLK